MTKISSKKTQKKAISVTGGLNSSQKWLLLAFVIFLIIILGFLANQYLGANSQKLASKTAQSSIQDRSSNKNFEASKSDTMSAKPSPTGPVIPANYGRSVIVPILTYHYIGENPIPDDKARDNLSVSPDKFDQELGILQKNGYHPISLDTLYAALKGGLLPSKPIVITFDDGYIDFYTNAFPIIKRYGFVVISFIPTGLMNQGYYLGWDQIKQMDASGLVSFQAHSVQHANLLMLTGDQLKYQVTESKRVLEEKLGKKVNFMAYPYGSSNALTWQAAKDAGYFGALGTWYGTTESEGTVFDMPRVKIAGSWSIDQFARMFP